METKSHIAIIALSEGATAKLRQRMEVFEDQVEIDIFPNIQSAEEAFSKNAKNYLTGILDAGRNITSSLNFYKRIMAQRVAATLFICAEAPRELVLDILASGVDELIDKDPENRYQEFLPNTLNRIIEHQQDSLARQEAEATLNAIANSLTDLVGKKFFLELSKRLSEALKVDYALVGEIRGTRKKKVRVVAATDNGKVQQNYEYLANDRPSNDIIEGRPTLIQSGLRKKFPNDAYLAKMEFESYAGVPLRDNKGEIRGLLSILNRKPLQNPSIVISALKLFAARTEIEMERVRFQDSLETQARMLDQIGLAAICTETDGSIKAWNKHAETLLGYSRNDILGKSLEVIFPDITTSNLNSQVIEPLLINGHITIETILCRDSGEKFDAAVTFSLEKSAKEEITGIIACARDITERRDAVRMRREAQQQLTFHINNTSLAYIKWDYNRQIADWNHAAERIFGYSKEEILGQSFEKLIPKEFAASCYVLFNELAKKSGGESSTNENICANGRRIVCEWHNTALLNEHDQVVGFASLVNDITDRIETERKLRESQSAAARANRSKDEFLSVMSHEIRTPMNSIIGFADLLIETQVEQSQRDNLEIIKSNAYQLLELINNVLNYSRLDSEQVILEKRDMDLPALLFEIEEAMSAEASQKGLKLTVTADPDLPRYIHTSYLELRQVLLSLVGNAIKFTSQGSVDIQVTGTYNESKKGPGFWNLCFAVKDTGIGIAEEHLDRIFASFSQVDSSSTRRYGGTGLGLAICRRICELLDGRVWARSSGGEGSTFYVEISAAVVLDRADSLPPIPINKDPDHLDGFARIYPSKIMIADDEQDTCRLLGDMLREMGYEPDVAMGGLECIELLQKDRYDLIFMDVAMPDIDGLEATHLIRGGQGNEENKAVFICAITAYAEGDDKQRCLEAGMNEHLGKPLLTKSLQRVIKKSTHSRTRI